MRCGHEGTDVEMKLANLEGEASEDGERLGTVTVAMAVDDSRHGPRGMEYAQVPARFGNEPRCHDRAACRGRVAEAKRTPAVEEVVPWL